MSLRIFLAHSIAHTDAEIADFKQAILECLGHAGVDDAEIVEGREDFKANFATAGGWRGWPHDVVTRRDYMTQEPVYGAFVLPGRTCGKATGQILEYAIERGRDVLVLDGGLWDVRSVRCMDSQDAKNGWVAETTDLLA